METSFRSSKEFKEVMDRIFTMMSEDPGMGPKLRDADCPQRFEFDDFDLVVNIRAGTSEEGTNLYWEWTDEVDWKPKVEMTMSSEMANRYFQGKENVALADRPAADQDRRRRQGGAGVDPDHQADLQALPRRRHRRVPAPQGMTTRGLTSAGGRSRRTC